MNKIINSDCLSGLKELPAGCVHTCVTSPPYFGLRDYGVDGQIGLEPTPQDFVDALVAVFREVKRVLRDDGTVWLNLGDSYSRDPKRGERSPDNCGFHQHAKSGAGRASQYRTSNGGIPDKNLIGIPWRVAFALQQDGWYLRQDIIWHKPNPMPESVTDRCTKSHEYIFLLSKSPKYYYDSNLIREKAVGNTPHDLTGSGADAPGQTKQKGNRTDKQRGHSRRHAGFNDRWDSMSRAEQCSGFRNRRDVWTVATRPYKEAHFATFPPELIRPCILAGAPAGGLVLDPFMGAGTTAMVAKQEGRNYVGFELNPEYIKIAEKRLASVAHLLEGLI